jgi:hypothetical protein
MSKLPPLPKRMLRFAFIALYYILVVILSIAEAPKFELLAGQVIGAALLANGVLLWWAMGKIVEPDSKSKSVPPGLPMSQVLEDPEAGKEPLVVSAQSGAGEAGAESPAAPMGKPMESGQPTPPGASATVGPLLSSAPPQSPSPVIYPQVPKRYITVRYNADFVGRIPVEGSVIDEKTVKLVKIVDDADPKA